MPMSEEYEDKDHTKSLVKDTAAIPKTIEEFAAIARDAERLQIEKIKQRISDKRKIMQRTAPSIPDDVDGRLPDRETLEIFDQIRVISFNATPSAILPFQMSTLAWEVAGPKDKFQLKFLGSQILPNQGSLAVTPIETTTYSLFAKVKNFSKVIATETIIVNLDSCRFQEYADVFLELTIENRIAQRIEDEEMLYEKKIPTVDVTLDGIEMRLLMGVDVPYLANPTIKARIRFGFYVTENQIRPRIYEIDVSVDWPWHDWAVPGALFALPIITGSIRDDVRNALIEGANELASLLQGLIPSGNRAHSIRFTSAGDAVMLVVVSCPLPFVQPVTQLKTTVSEK